MSLTIAQKSAIRRHLKYPVVGLYRLNPAGGSLAQGAVGYRFFQAYGQLEYKLNNLNPDEEARLTGAALAAVAFSGPKPNPGDTVTVTFSGGPLGAPTTIQATAAAAGDATTAYLALCQNLVQAAAVNTALQAAGIYAAAPYGTGPFAANAVPVPEVMFTLPSAFTASVAFTGSIIAFMSATGARLPPSAPIDLVNPALVTWGYIPLLDGLEYAYASTSQNLDTLKADVWTARGNEAGQRRSLYENWVQLMSDFIGVPVCNFARQRPRRTGAMSMV